MELLPCPFCGAGTTRVVMNGQTWTGTKYSDPISVSVIHHCDPVEGQPSRLVERVGRDEESAIAAWNRRASPASVPEGFTMSEPAILPDGSGFGTMSFPLPKDHWIYKEREYEDGAIEPNDLPAPILTHSFRRQVIAAIRYAVRGATNCGKEDDFDPDALVQNAVYALCGPYVKAAPTPPVSESVDPVMTKEELIAAAESIGMRFPGASIPPVSEDRWLPIETAPKDEFVLLAGPSGYTTIETVFATGRMCSDYHVGRWIDHANDDLTDWGFEPTHWMPLPEAPAMQEDKP